MVKIGIIGAGKRYRQMYNGIIDSLNGKVDIVGFVTNSGMIGSDIGNYKVFKNITDLCNNNRPDFLISITPFQLNTSMVLEACENKCDILVETPVGNIFHTGDWKCDPNPLIGENVNSKKLKKIGEEGILAMVCDSTNVFNFRVLFLYQI